MGAADKFFSGAGIKTGTLTGVGLKMNKENEKRIRLDFEFLLTEDSIKGAPKVIRKAYDNVSVLSNGQEEVKISTEFEGTTLEFYATPDNTSPVLTIHNATIRKVEVFRPDVAEGATDEVYLAFNMTIPAETMVWGWAYESIRSSVFTQFFETQPELRGIGDDEYAQDRAKAVEETRPEEVSSKRKKKEVAEPVAS